MICKRRPLATATKAPAQGCSCGAVAAAQVTPIQVAPALYAELVKLQLAYTFYLHSEQINVFIIYPRSSIGVGYVCTGIRHSKYYITT